MEEENEIIITSAHYEQPKLNIKNLEPEIYYMIFNFLQSKGLKDAAKMLEMEFNRNNTSHMRIDWEGDNHPSTLSQLIEKCKVTKDTNIMDIFEGMFEILYKHPSDEFKGLTSILSSNFPSKSSRDRLLQQNDKPSLMELLDRRKRGIPNRSTNVSHMVRHMVDNISLRKRIRGHRSCTYCLLFDRTYTKIITGSDDALIKIWNALNGRLVATLRGHTGPVCDISINLDNTLLASGSCDKTVRVWCTENAAELYIFRSHTSIITSVQFSPPTAHGNYYLVSTGNDAVVCFWTVTGLEIDPQPQKFSEKIKSNSHLVTSSFSLGGTLLVVGSSDGHVYIFKINDVITKIGVLDTQPDRVDTLQFSHSGERFISCATVGNARIWSPRNSTWFSVPLPICNNNDSAEEVYLGKKIKIISVTWSQDDRYIFGSLTDCSIRIWCSTTGEMMNIFNKHVNYPFIVETFPSAPHLFLSAGHDGIVVIWDMFTSAPIKVFEHKIDAGACCVFDAKISPHDFMIATADSAGYVSIFSFGSESAYLLTPNEQFFHTDYRPITMLDDETIDDQLNLRPHLMPPPYLVTLDGTMHSLTQQALTLGRINYPIILSINLRSDSDDTPLPPPSSDPESMLQHRMKSWPNFYDNSLSRQDWRRWKKREIILQLSESEIKYNRACVDETRERETKFYQDIALKSDPNDVTKDERYNKLVSLTTKAIQNQQMNEANVEETNTDTVMEDTTVHVASSDESVFNTDGTTNDGYSDDTDFIIMPVRREICTRRNVYVPPPGQSVSEEEVEESQFDTESPTETTIPLYSEVESVTNTPSPLNTEHTQYTLIPSIIGERPDIERDCLVWKNIEYPTRSPYVPQLGDIVIYNLSGHKEYVCYVMKHNLFPIHPNRLCYNKTTLNEMEVCRVWNITYYSKPPYYANIVLTKMDASATFNTGVNFTVQYIDLLHVDDFIILKQFFDQSTTRHWKVNQTFHSYVDSQWYEGKIVEMIQFDHHQLFRNTRVRWTTGEEDLLSPWDLFSTISSPNRLLYRATHRDWFPDTCRPAYEHIRAGLVEIQQIPLYEQVDKCLKENSHLLAFPTCFEKICKRCVNMFYRRRAAVIWEIRMIHNNMILLKVDTELLEASKYLTDTLIAHVKSARSEWNHHEQSSGKTSTGSETEREIPMQLRWVVDAVNIVVEITTKPFARPFLTCDDFPSSVEYRSIVKKHMDFATISAKLSTCEYITPDHFVEDMKLVVKNALAYHTDTRSPIHAMALKLKKEMDRKIKNILPSWNKRCLNRDAHITRNITNELTKYLKNSESRIMPLLNISPIKFPTNIKRKRMKKVEASRSKHKTSNRHDRVLSESENECHSWEEEETSTISSRVTRKRHSSDLSKRIPKQPITMKSKHRRRRRRKNEILEISMESSPIEGSIECSENDEPIAKKYRLRSSITSDSTNGNESVKRQNTKIQRRHS